MQPSCPPLTSNGWGRGNIRCDGHVVNDAVVTTHHAKLLYSCLEIPQSNRLVHRAGDEPAAVLTERKPLDGILVTGERSHMPVLFPDSHCLVPAANRDSVSFGADGDRRDVFRLPRQSGQHFFRGHVPANQGPAW